METSGRSWKGGGKTAGRGHLCKWSHEGKGDIYLFLSRYMYIQGCQKNFFLEFSSDQPDYHSIWGYYDPKKFWLLKNDIFLYGII